MFRKISKRVKRIGTEFRERGARGAFRRLGKDFWSTVEWRVFVCDRNKIVTSSVLEPNYSLVTFTEPDSEILQRLVAEWPDEFRGAKDSFILEQFRRRLNDGGVCYLLRDGETIVACVWVTMPDSTANGYLGDGSGRDRVLTQGFIAPEYRGRRLFPPFLGAVMSHESNESVERFIGLVAKWNIKSAKSLERNGFLEIGAAVVRTRFNVTRTVFSPSVPSDSSGES